MIHKKIKVLLGTMALASMAYAQQPPQGTPGGGAFWRLGGNFGGIGSPNIFGTAVGNNNPIYTCTNGINRTTLLGTVLGPYDRSGFLGLNDNNPSFHLDINTPEPDGNNNYGELMLRARIADDPNAYISFVNISTQGTTFTPTLLARQSNNPSSALTTIGLLI